MLDARDPLTASQRPWYMQSVAMGVSCATPTVRAWSHDPMYCIAAKHVSARMA